MYTYYVLTKNAFGVQHTHTRTDGRTDERYHFDVHMKVYVQHFQKKSYLMILMVTKVYIDPHTVVL